MKLVLDRHYPADPVCDADGVLLGLVRGQAMFQEQAFDITAQAGTMVGVEKEERLATRWSQSFKFRHPWLQLNLITAFAAGAVVGMATGRAAGTNGAAALDGIAGIAAGACTGSGLATGGGALGASAGSGGTVPWAAATASRINVSAIREMSAAEGSCSG